jgi:hypothetical protein
MMLECIKDVFGTNSTPAKNEDNRQVEQFPAGDVLKAAPEE